MASGEPAEGSAAPAPVPHAAADTPSPSRGRALSWRRIRLVLAVLAVASIVAAGVLTRDVTGAGGIAGSDQSLMLMQRMGPPPAMIGLYELLAADTVAVRNSSTGQLISTGLYAGDVIKPATVPGLLGGLPASVKRAIELGASNSYLAYFVAPARGITSRSVRVVTSWKQLDGTVIRTDRAADLSVIAVVVPQDQVSKFYVPLPIDAQPARLLSLAMLLVHRNPAVYTRSAGFALTSGGVSGGQAWCGLPVSGASAGSPVAYVSPAGAMSLLGLAVPSSVPGRCSVIGSWTVAQVMAAATAPGRGGAG